jgi:hypothetical protein
VVVVLDADVEPEVPVPEPEEPEGVGRTVVPAIEGFMVIEGSFSSEIDLSKSGKYRNAYLILSRRL